MRRGIDENDVAKSVVQGEDNVTEEKDKKRSAISE